MPKRLAAATVEEHLVAFRNGKPDIVLDMWASGWDWEDTIDSPVQEDQK